jgi:hypothetical protein
MQPQITTLLRQVMDEAEQAGREIYYAMSFLDYTHPARANLKQALKCLGVNKPEDVGLSSSVLSRNKYEKEGETDCP